MSGKDKTRLPADASRKDKLVFAGRFHTSRLFNTRLAGGAVIILREFWNRAASSGEELHGLAQKSAVQPRMHDGLGCQALAKASGSNRVFF
jgi:hypothetical protein